MTSTSSPFYRHLLSVAGELLSADAGEGGTTAAVSARSIQTLWGGMGQVLRVSAEEGKSNSASQPLSLVVKFVNPPPHALDASAVGDKEYRGMLRKLISFTVEGGFYEHVSGVMAGYDALFDAAVAEQEKEAVAPNEAFDYDCRMPRCLRVESKYVGDEADRTDTANRYGPHAAQHAFFLEDLAAAGYNQRRHPSPNGAGPKGSLVSNEVRDCLAWLAAFHARSIKYLQEETGCYSGTVDPPTFSYTFDVSDLSMDTNGRAKGCGELLSLGGAVDLWRTGTYWHVGTRPDELKTMLCGTKDKVITRLGQCAQKIDDALNVTKMYISHSGARKDTSSPATPLRHPCLLHGDPKVANFCFPTAGQYATVRRSRVAALDFQYTGLGCGMRDVAYFLEDFNGFSSGGDGSEHAKACLDTYFCALKTNLAILLPPQHPQLGDSIESEWRPLYGTAAADLSRFMCGWSGPYLDDSDRSNVEAVLNGMA